MDAGNDANANSTDANDDNAGATTATLPIIFAIVGVAVCIFLTVCLVRRHRNQQAKHVLGQLASHIIILPRAFISLVSFEMALEP